MRLDDRGSRDALLRLLPTLTDFVHDEPDVLMKLTSLNCIDLISEKYGKKDKPAIARCAETISSAQCLGHADPRLRTMALLCLTSMVEVLDQVILPILPKALPRALDHLRETIEEQGDTGGLHNAVYSFLNALLTHVPWIITGEYLDSILQLSYGSSNAEMGEPCDNSRKESLLLLATHVAFRDLCLALERSWASGVSEGPQVRMRALSGWHRTKSRTGLEEMSRCPGRRYRQAAQVYDSQKLLGSDHHLSEGL